jgi:predicted O-methyltransferase YrrM
MIVEPRIESYIASLDGRTDTVLAAMEALAERRSFPIVGPHVGSLLAMLARLMGARRVLELGSGYGYSALWFARALAADGKVVCTDLTADNRDLAMGFFRSAGVEGKIEFLVGDGLEIARRQAGPFDIVFNDIDKVGYPASLPVIASRLRPGGLLITDNLLWHGRILDVEDQSPDTAGVREFTRLVTTSPEWTASIVPIRDGLLVARRN